MQPKIENIQANPGNSFYMASGLYGATEAFWHIHPEYELVYIKNGSAEQHIGSHYSKYSNGTLLLIGPNIPHSNMGNYDYDNNLAVVIQMPREFIEKQLLGFYELHFIEGLIMRSKQGIWFGDTVKTELTQRIENLSALDSYQRLITLFDILKTLSLTSDYKLLNANGIFYNSESNSYKRVAQINQYVTQNYQSQIQLSKLSELTGLTESSFSRFFKQMTGKTFVTFLNEYRINKACELITKNTCNISEVMYKTGFNEAAHFTRVFKKYTKYTPREYRSMFIKSPRIYSESNK